MFKTILKTAVLSAITITFLSACGAATRAINSALNDFENRTRSAATQINVDEFGNPIQINTDGNGNPVLTAAKTAEICSDKDAESLWESPCDNDEASIKRRDEHCLEDPFNGNCLWDDRYNTARGEICAVNPFTDNCLNQLGVRNEYIDLRVQFCNNPANANNSSCFIASEPRVGSDGYIRNEFLQGTANGLNTGSLRASPSDATAPVVHTLKLSDSDDGVAFFAGVSYPDAGQDFALEYRHYAGILSETNLGAPITQTRGNAVWHGTFSVIDSDATRIDRDLELKIDFSDQKLSAFVDVSDEYDFSIYGWFSNNGAIEGGLHRARYPNNELYTGRDEDSLVLGDMRGLIGQDGVVAAFISNDSGDDLETESYSGGFVARPPSK